MHVLYNVIGVTDVLLFLRLLMSVIIETTGGEYMDSTYIFTPLIDPTYNHNNNVEAHCYGSI